ncbi:MAG: AMP-binding protein [Planctomycetes bacterium]|nr:AMP-binding protein [Planctomycetota bacterium]
MLHYLALVSRGLTPAILTPPNRKLQRDYYVTQMRAVVEACGFSAVITDLEDCKLPVHRLRPFTLDSSDGTIARARGVADDVSDAAFLQFSSGTTGFKRGVLIDHPAVLAQLAACSQAIELSDRDTIVSWLPLYHDMGFIACLNMPLASGVHCVMLQPLDWVARPGLYLQAVSRYHGTLSWHPNFAFSFMAQRVRAEELKGVELSSVRGLVNCSEPVTRTSQDCFLERFQACGLRSHVFWGCYAMAETTFALTHGTAHDAGYFDHQGPTDGPAQMGGGPHVSVGRPLPGVELIAADGDLGPLEDGTVGELCVRSPFNLRRYYNNPAATTAALQDG